MNVIFSSDHRKTEARTIDICLFLEKYPKYSNALVRDYYKNTVTEKMDGPG